MTWFAEHWASFVAPVGAASLSWLARRRLAGSWRWLMEVRRANERLTACHIDRDDAIRSRDYALAALREITAATAMLKAAQADGSLTIQTTSPASLMSSPPGSDPS